MVFALSGTILAGGVSADNETAARDHPPAGWSKTSLDGHFRITVASLLVPLRINRMHGWTVAVTASDGSPVTDARLTIGGGAPDVARPLPTAPRVTRHLGGGRYLIEGVRFNMPGRWRLDLAVESGHLRDRINFEFDVP